MGNKSFLDKHLTVGFTAFGNAIKKSNFFFNFYLPTPCSCLSFSPQSSYTHFPWILYLFPLALPLLHPLQHSQKSLQPNFSLSGSFSPPSSPGLEQILPQYQPMLSPWGHIISCVHDDIKTSPEDNCRDFLFVEFLGKLQQLLEPQRTKHQKTLFTPICKFTGLN